VSEPTKITEADMLSMGWTKGEFPYLYEKKLPNRNPINSDPNDTDITLVIHSMENAPRPAVLLPNGAMLNFVANSIEELKRFESQIDYYDCEY
jgi:hypothetical protein